MRGLDQHEGDPKGRLAAEQQLRDAYVEKAVDMLLELADAPAVVEAHVTTEPRKALARALGGARAKTLRARLRIWQAMRGWMLGAYGVAFPTRPAQVIDYLQTRAEEPCSRSTFFAIDGCLRFVEKACGYTAGAAPITHTQSHARRCRT